MKWVTAVISKLKGTMPDPKVEFIMSTMMGHRLGRHTLTKALGMGSREQGEGLMPRSERKLHYGSFRGLESLSG